MKTKYLSSKQILLEEMRTFYCMNCINIVYELQHGENSIPYFKLCSPAKKYTHIYATLFVLSLAAIFLQYRTSVITCFNLSFPRFMVNCLYFYFNIVKNNEKQRHLLYFLLLS